jgi:hypothetical protein
LIKKNIKYQMSKDEIEKQLNQIQYNWKIEDYFTILQGQHSFWGKERKYEE